MAPHFYSVVEQRIYYTKFNDASEHEVDLVNGATLTLTPSKTYDILCSDTRYVKQWYKVDTQGASMISRYAEYTKLNEGSTPEVYATNPGGHALTLHFESFQSTDSGEYECRLRSSADPNLPTMSLFLSKLQPVALMQSVKAA